MDYVEALLKKTRTTLVFSVDEPKIEGNKVGGYFSDEDNEIVITSKDGWDEILVHEFCHYLQCKEKSKYWTNLDIDNTNCLDLMWKWLNNEIELSKPKLDMIFARVRDMELDCERRTVKLIKQFNMTIDIKEYICQANIYIYYYNYAKVTRKWFPSDIGPSNMDKLFPLMPRSMSGPRSKMTDEIHKSFGFYFS